MAPCGPCWHLAAVQAAFVPLALLAGRAAGRCTDTGCLGSVAAADPDEVSLLQRSVAVTAEASSWDHGPGTTLKHIPTWARGGDVARALERLEGPSRGLAEPRYWDAPVDHFAPPWGSKDTFRQKYYVNTDHYKSGGPVFFELGGEGPLGGPPGGFIEALAKDRGALLVAVEHRFYGESVPYGNVNTSNLQLLTVDQALADYAGFIDWLSKQDPSLGKWFAFGGSYPGALSSWFRAAYPDKTVGSLSSSGVVNAIFDFAMFDVHVARAVGPRCADAHRAVTAAFEAAILARGHREAFARGLFGCRASMLDGDFLFMLADGLAMMVQYGLKSRLCTNLTAVSSTAEQIMENAAQLIKGAWGEHFGTMCYYDTDCVKDPSRYEVGATDRSWRWQTCYEIPYLQSAPLPGQTENGVVLPQSLRSSLVNMSYMVQQCYSIFGFNPSASSIESSARRINAKFGGAQPRAQRVFYSNFGDDPWLEASVMPPRDVDEQQPYEVALCENCGHCMDFGRPKASDPAEVQRVRARFEKYLDLWLS